ncbi:uncharacterized protein LOC122856913 isoform X2 [Aphidius gifuensis]|uniref:uncharacterized protein LOC122856913 isoform X2 n=1 Tax=Aphidius gifuensis TaxID=684658 RepID=UPI001CDCD9BF|nr:uncharacterized protein LOC122856913 isoform X2 [Aphidius gifuensis]
MRRTTILLLCAVAFINASPYTKIPEAHSQTHANLNIGNYEESPEANGYASANAVSNAYASSSANARAEANSNAYAVANANAHAEANAHADGHIHGASKCTNDAHKNDKYDELSQSEYRGIPQGFHSAHYRPDNIDELSKNDREQHNAVKSGHYSGENYKQQTGNNQYWWMGNNSPFESNKKTSVVCSSAGCNSNKGNAVTPGSSQIGQVTLNLHGNPFLQGGVSSSSVSSFNSGSFQTGVIKENYNKQDHSKNPFLNGGSSATAAASANTYPKQQISSTTAKAISAGNPFFNNAGFGSSQATASASASASAAASANAYPSEQISSTTIKTIGAGNPFFNNAGVGSSQASAVATASASASANSFSNGNSASTFGSNNQFVNSIPQVPQSTELPPYENDVPNKNYDQSYDNYEQQNIQSGFGLKLTCSGQGKICVAKNLCNNGYVSQNFQGLTQVRSGNQQCDVNREVCCNIKNDYSVVNNDQSPESTVFGNVNLPGNNGIIYHPDQSNGLFGDANIDQDFDFNSGDHVSKGSGGGTLNGYLPPDGNPSNTIENVIKPKPTTTPPPPPPTRKPIEPAPTHLDLGGCAAALLCVESSLCGKDGVISSTRMSLTQEQLLQRVALSSCTIPGPPKQDGVCCRDPNYTDPWPTGKLPADFDGTYDEQGFPSYLNIQKNRPPQKKNGNPVKTSFTSVISTTQQPPRQIYTTPQPTRQIYTTPQPTRQIYTTSAPLYTTPQRIEQSNVYTSPKPFIQPFAPSVVPIFQKPQQVIPNYPIAPIPFNKVIVDEPSSTNVKLTVISPHTPGTQCGVKNSVERPEYLKDEDVAFGEIPWQVMVLSLQKKSILCGGALIAPNAVLTSARCVDGYKPQDISIKVGEWKLGYELKEQEPLPFEIVFVKQVVSHPGYQSGSVAYDVAVLLLEHPVKLDRHVDTICLSEKLPTPDMKCISTGWGKFIIENHVAGALMHSIDVDVIGKQECLQRLEGAESKIDIDDSLVCAKAHRQNNNMCQVDLGSPLACDRGDGNYAIMGVYTQETGCSPIDQVTTFATIDYAWIKYVLDNPTEIEQQQQQTTTDVPQVIELSTSGINIYQAPQYLPPK